MDVPVRHPKRIPAMLLGIVLGTKRVYCCPMFSPSYNAWRSFSSINFHSSNIYEFGVGQCASARAGKSPIGRKLRA